MEKLGNALCLCLVLHTHYFNFQFCYLHTFYKPNNIKTMLKLIFKFSTMWQINVPLWTHVTWRINDEERMKTLL